MKYNTKELQAKSKQRYIDLGIIHLPNRISGKEVDKNLRQQARLYIKGKINKQKCVDCGNQANYLHHNISYERKHWDNIIPMCVSCQKSLIAKIGRDIYYNYGMKLSITNYINSNNNITNKQLAEIHGVTAKRIADTIRRHGITIQEQAQGERPNGKTYDVKAIQEESKQRYIRLGIVHLPLQISVDSDLKKQARLYIKNSVIGMCVDCGDQATYWHHNVSYERENWDRVIPMCWSCHESLIHKLERGVFYNYGMKLSITNYLANDVHISSKQLAEIHGVETIHITRVTRRHSITNNFNGQTQVQEERPSNELLLYYVSIGLTTSRLSDKFEVSKATIKGWVAGARYTKQQFMENLNGR